MKISNLYQTNYAMIKLTKRKKLSIKTQQLVTIVQKRLNHISIMKVRDHSHLIGKYLRPLCVECNFLAPSPSFVPVYFHNLSYDRHFIIYKLGYDDMNIDVIPNSCEKYITFSEKIKDGFYVKFIDTFRFMSESFANLTNNLAKDKSKFRETK
jgi:hypothetical protein